MIERKKTLIHVGIDDFAYKKRHTYGVVLVDHESGQIIDILRTRNVEDIIELLKRFPTITHITRDGADCFRNAIGAALPNAIQIADNFHVLANIAQYAKESMLSILPAYINYHTPESIENTEKFEVSEATKKKQALVQYIRERYAVLGSIRAVHRETGLSTVTIRKYLHQDARPKRHPVPHQFDPYLDQIEDLIKAGNATKTIVKVLKAQGVNVAYSSLTEYLRLHAFKKGRRVSAKLVTKLLYNNDIDCLKCTDTQKEIVSEYLADNPTILDIIVLVKDYRLMIAERNAAKLKDWLARAEELATKVPGIEKIVKLIYRDYDAIEAGLTYKMNNGRLEGIVNKIKAIKRQMFNRAAFELLRARVLESSQHA